MRLIAGLSLLVLCVATSFAQVGKPTDTDKAGLTKAETAYKQAKAAFTKKPKDAKLKKTYVAATVKFGTATMTSGSLGPKQKYPGALKLYREALQFDPKNAEALANKKMIEDIYKSMNRPIPK